ncbi:MAG: hypothetical protein AAF790_07265 [Planctomycetota bacterium]
MRYQRRRAWGGGKSQVRTTRAAMALLVGVLAGGVATGPAAGQPVPEPLYFGPQQPAAVATDDPQAQVEDATRRPVDTQTQAAPVPPPLRSQPGENRPLPSIAPRPALQPVPQNAPAEPPAVPPAPATAPPAPIALPPGTGGVPATPAVQSARAPSLRGGFNVRLARAPKMLGDFFGNAFATARGDAFFGEAVHHLAGTASGMNEIRLIDDTGMVTTYGATAFVPIIAPPAPALIEGLTLPGGNGNGDGVGSGVVRSFIAQDTGDTVDVFENPGDTMADLTNAPLYAVFEVFEFDLPAAGPADLVGRTRLQDNNSAMPEDRIYFDYSFFHNASLAAGGVDVSRFAPGFEKTFLDGMASVEVRVPMGVSFASQQTVGAGPDVSSYEFGNVVIAPKLLLSADDDLALAVGLGVALPTADDIVLRLPGGADFLRVQNESVHLLPYAALLYAPRGTGRFAHAFLTFDFDLNGNTTSANLTGAGLEEIGTWNDQHLVSLNLALGRWVYRNTSPSTRLEGVAISGELHYTATLNGSDVVSGGAFVVGRRGADLSVLNGTVGAHVRVGQTTFTAGYTAPLNSDERVFDGELRLFANRAF